MLTLPKAWTWAMTSCLRRFSSTAATPKSSLETMRCCFIWAIAVSLMVSMPSSLKQGLVSFQAPKPNERPVKDSKSPVHQPQRSIAEYLLLGLSQIQPKLAPGRMARALAEKFLHLVA